MIMVIFRVHLSLEGMRKAAVTQTGANDARRIIWAKGTSFLYFLHIFFY